MAFDFLVPVDEAVVLFVKDLSIQQLGRKISIHSKADFPNLEIMEVVILGVPEFRGSEKSYESTNLNSIRKEFYSLFPGNWPLTMADLGDIVPGDTIEDTYYVVRTLVANLVKMGVVPIIIGGSQDLTYPLYRAYDMLEQAVNLVCIDKKFDFGKEYEALTETSYLSKILLEEPNNLFNYSNVGYQTYYSSQEEIDLMQKLYFDAYRLGDVSHNITISEPVFRDADLVSLDLTSVQSAASGNFVTYSPNGFTGKEVCALARYAGISDRVSVFGMFNHNNSKIEAVLMAQIIWYFMEGYYFRSNEFPFGNKDQYLKYIVPFDDQELVFYKSNKTDRWWIEIPFEVPGNNKLKRNTLLPCSYEEYVLATNAELPERWWKAQRKNAL